MRDHHVAQCGRGDPRHLQPARPRPGPCPGHRLRARLPPMRSSCRCCRPSSWTSPGTAGCAGHSARPLDAQHGRRARHVARAASSSPAGLGDPGGWPARSSPIKAMASRFSLTVLWALLGRTSPRTPEPLGLSRHAHYSGYAPVPQASFWLRTRRFDIRSSTIAEQIMGTTEEFCLPGPSFRVSAADLSTASSCAE